MAVSLRSLSAVEARVLGVLVEKERTVPDVYPMTVNALLAGCNQKTSRDPVMELREPEVLAALESLRRDSLVIESSGSRAMRYAHNAKRVLEIPTESLALLFTLVLRGPQTAAELRANAERLHKVSDVSAAEAFLEELAARPGGALVVELARTPGTRETRWAHLLCGPVTEPTAAQASPSRHEPSPAPAPGVAAATAPAAQAAFNSHEATSLRNELAELRTEVATLRAELSELRDAVHSLRDELNGLERARPSDPLA